MRQLLLRLDSVLFVLRKALGVFGAAVVELLFRFVELPLPFSALSLELFFAALILGRSAVELEPGDLQLQSCVLQLLLRLLELGLARNELVELGESILDLLLLGIERCLRLLDLCHRRGVELVGVRNLAELVESRLQR